MVMCFIIGIIMFVIGACFIIAGFIMTDDTDMEHCVLNAYGWAGVIVGMLIIVITLTNKSVNENKTINGSSTEIETLTETQSVKTSDIKVAILNKYNGAEIISSDKPEKEYFIYEQEKYNYELEDNILFINKDNKTVDYLYVN